MDFDRISTLIRLCARRLEAGQTTEQIARECLNVAASPEELWLAIKAAEILVR